MALLEEQEVCSEHWELELKVCSEQWEPEQKALKGEQLVSFQNQSVCFDRRRI